MSIQNAYNEWSGIYDTNTNLTRDLDAQIMRETLASLRFTSILELGCGTGKNTSFLVKIGTRVTAVDFSVGMLEKAKEKVKAENVNFSMMDITHQWNFNEQSFDLIVCNLVLEHIANLSHIFTEAARTLQPNGKFFINELHPFKQYQGTKARFEKEGEVLEVEAFVHHISDFIHAAEEHGLKLASLHEYWHEADQGKPPRLLTLLFEKAK
jgi:ubiquinone/menaquinone biosynthesis C-methylase UbiE